MRVVHVLRKCDPSAWGGTEMAMQRVFDGLREQQVTPIIYCPRLERNPGREILTQARNGRGMREADPLALAGHRVERFRAFLPVLGIAPERRRQLISVGGNLMSFDLIPALRREKGVDLIHAHTLGRIGGIALTVAKRRNVPFVVTIHGGVLDLPDRLKASFNESRGGGWEWGKFFGLLFQSHRLFVDADAIFTCNDREAALLRQQHPGKRIVVQPHGVDLGVYEQDYRSAALEAYPCLAGRRVLLCLGRVDPVKNQAWVFEQGPRIAASYPDAVLVFAGAATDEVYATRLQVEIGRSKSGLSVLSTGGLPPNDPRLIGLLQQAEVLILPSVSETFGLVILEAWAARTPVITSRTSGALALVEDGSNGLLFDLEVPSTFHAALGRMLNDKEFARSTAHVGYEKVRRSYSIATVASMLKRTYEEVIQEKLCAR